MGAHREFAIDAITKILSLEHLLEGDTAIEPDHILKTHSLKPLAVEADGRPCGVKNLESLGLVALGILHDLIVGEMRTCYRAAARIADHRGEITDDEDGLMAQFLELTQLGQPDRVTEMNIGRGWIDTKFHPKRASQIKLSLEFIFAQHLGTTGEKRGELF